MSSREYKICTLSGSDVVLFNPLQPAKALAREFDLLATGLRIERVTENSFRELMFAVAHTPEKRIIGIRSFFDWNDDKGQRTFYPDILEVSEDWHGCGIGKALMHYFFDSAERVGAEVGLIGIATKEGYRMAELIRSRGYSYKVGDSLKAQHPDYI